MQKMTRQKLMDMLSKKFATYSKNAVNDLADSLWFRMSSALPSFCDESAWSRFVAGLSGDAINVYENRS